MAVALKMTRAQLDAASVTRLPGFVEAVTANASADGDTYKIDGDCWSNLTVAFAKRPTAGGFGLGDAVAAVAQPIAGAIDAVLGTNIKGCGGCAKRRAALNALVPKL